MFSSGFYKHGEDETWFLSARFDHARRAWSPRVPQMLRRDQCATSTHLRCTRAIDEIGQVADGAPGVRAGARCYSSRNVSHASSSGRRPWAVWPCSGGSTPGTVRASTAATGLRKWNQPQNAANESAARPETRPSPWVLRGSGDLVSGDPGKCGRTSQSSARRASRAKAARASQRQELRQDGFEEQGDEETPRGKRKIREGREDLPRVRLPIGYGDGRIVEEHVGQTLLVSAIIPRHQSDREHPPARSPRRCEQEALVEKFAPIHSAQKKAAAPAPGRRSDGNGRGERRIPRADQDPDERNRIAPPIFSSGVCGRTPDLDEDPVLPRDREESRGTVVPECSMNRCSCPPGVGLHRPATAP